MVESKTGDRNMVAHLKTMELKNHAWMLEQLKVMSMSQLAKQLGCTHSSVKYVVDRYFSEDMKSQIKYERKPHSNNRKVKSNKEGE